MPTASKKTKVKRIKVEFPVFVDAANGYINIRICKTEGDAEKFAQENLDKGNSSLSNEVQWVSITVNEKGQIVGGFDEVPESEEGDEEEV